MEALYQAGRIRAIGVSNFATDRVMDFLMHQQVAPMVNQIETHPFCQQIEAQRFLQEHRVQMQSWGPFAEGRNNLFQHEVLQDIARSHAKSVAQVVLRWLLQRGVVAIPKTVKRERLAENMAVLDFALTDAEMQTIVALDTQTSSFFDHRDPAVVMRLSQLVRAT
jgi:2,5-diketo-D-gluconate reductase A